MDIDTAAALRQVHLAIRRLLGGRLQLATNGPQTGETDPHGEAIDTRSEVIETGSRAANAKHSEAKASGG